VAKVCDNKSVGMLVRNRGKFLLIERKLFPFGLAPPAGHVDNKGSYENAAKEELEEEVGLLSTEIELIEEGRKDNKCKRKGGNWHYWKIYNVKVKGKLKPSKRESKQAGWYSRKQLRELSKLTEEYLKRNISEKEWQKSPGIETVWYEWFKNLEMI